eukprot:gene929-6008_t
MRRTRDLLQHAKCTAERAVMRWRTTTSTPPHEKGMHYVS